MVIRNNWAMGRMVVLVTMAVVWATGPVGWAADEPAGQARRLLEQSGVAGGLVVHVGCGDGRLTAALRVDERYLVHGLDRDPVQVEQARRWLMDEGLYGPVSVDVYDGEHLPYADNLVNLVVVEQPGAVAMSQVMRVLCPGGVAMVRQEGRWVRQVKPPVEGTDTWTHFLHEADNNAVGRDEQVGPPRRMQWLAGPMWDRYHHTLASISAVVTDGRRLYAIVDESPSASIAIGPRWSVVARDAYNGLLLWRRSIGSWADYKRPFRSGPVQLPRLLVATGGRVYVPLGLKSPLTALDGATGRTVKTYPQTAGTEEVLVSGGTAYVVVGRPGPEQGLSGRAGGPVPNGKTVMAIDTQSGKTLWQWSDSAEQPLMPLTLAVAGGRAVFQAGQAVVCLDSRSGRQIWRTGRAGPEGVQAGEGRVGKSGKGRGGKTGKGAGQRRPGWSVATLVLSGDSVLWADGGRLSVMNLSDGRLRWQCPCKPTFRSPVDVLVVDGVVWLGQEFTEGRDLASGRVVRQMPTADVWTAGHHHRCYRTKATGRYILTSYRGVEFLDLVGREHGRNNWVRGECQYGILPANGLLYAPSHPCGCYMEARLTGFWALAGQGPQPAPPVADEKRLHRGPGWAEVKEQRGPDRAVQEWPTLRGDMARSGSSDSALPAGLKRLWSVDLGHRRLPERRQGLTSPTVAGGRVYVACMTDHAVYGLDGRTGRRLWRFVTGGPVDSTPTAWGGRVYFGSADGWVYCLKADDGQLVWKFLAAPTDCRVVCMGQVESRWPVHGSVLLMAGPEGRMCVYAVAGRSTYLDGGLDLWALDARTGDVVAHRHLASESPTYRKSIEHKKSDQPIEKIAQNAMDWKTYCDPDRSDAFSMAGGVLNEVLVSDGQSLYLKHLRFDNRLRRLEGYGRHLFSTTSLLDDSEHHRSHWALGNADFSRMPVAYSWIANRHEGWHDGTYLAVPYGLMLCFDAQRVWGVWREYTNAGGYRLFARTVPGLQPPRKSTADVYRTDWKGLPPMQWLVDLPLHPRAMVRAGDVLVLGGTQTVSQAAEPYAAYMGQAGGELVTVSAGDGKILARQALDSPPVWNGLAVAGDRLYLVGADGQVSCWGR